MNTYQDHDDDIVFELAEQAPSDLSHANSNGAVGGTREVQIDKPLIFLDVQTTGLDARTARIVGLATLKIAPDRSESFTRHIFNPHAPIGPEATAKHGLSSADVADAPKFGKYARALAEYLADSVLAGFGIAKLGMRVLRREFDIAGVPFDFDSTPVLDAMAMYHWLEPRDFAAAYRRYAARDDADADVDADSLRGESRLMAVWDIVQGQFATHQLPGNKASVIASFTYGYGRTKLEAIDEGGRFVWSNEGEPLLDFGKYRGHRLSDIHSDDADYLRWIAGNDSFTQEQRDIAGRASEGVMPTRH